LQIPIRRLVKVVSPGPIRATTSSSTSSQSPGSTCITGTSLLGTFVGNRTVSTTPVAASAIEPESIALGLATDGQAFRQLAGRVGPDVTGVTLVLADGSTVEATVANGWFAAWWPGRWSGNHMVPPTDQSLSPLGQSVPQSVEITTASGTTTQPLDVSDVRPTISTGPTGPSGSSALGS
jgi:hypothetical protein